MRRRLLLVLGRILRACKTHLLFSLLIRSRLYLSLVCFFHLILRVCASRSLIFGEFFVLLVRGWGQFHLIAQLFLGAHVLLLSKNRKFTLILDNFIAKEDFVDNFIVRSGLLEERIVHVAASGGVDSDEVASSLVFQDRFSDVLLVLEIGRLDQRLEEGRVFDRVVVHKPFDEVLHLDARLATVDILADHVVWRNPGSLDTVAKVLLLTFVIETLHSVLNFVERFLLSVEALDSDKIERIRHEIGLDRHVQGRVTSH